MKRLFLIIGLLSTLFISCSKDNNGKEAETEATLELSEKQDVVSVLNTATTQTITITTNQKTWDVTKTADWINVTKKGYDANIEILANETGAERQADVTFTAGDKTKKVTFKQAAGQVAEKETLVINPNGTITVPAAGETKTLNVATTAKSWNAKLPEGVTWITLTKEENSLTVTVSNNSNVERSAKIQFTAGSLKEVVTIAQEGNTEISSDFILPYLEPDATKAKVDAFETGRGSTLIPAEPGQSTGDIQYQTTNNITPQIGYVFNGENLVSVTAMFSSTDKKISDGYKTLLTNNKFVYDLNENKGNNPDQTYYTKTELNKTTGKVVNITAIVVKNGEYAGVVWRYKNTQAKPQPTFSKLYLGCTQFDNVTKDDIVKWESDSKETTFDSNKTVTIGDYTQYFFNLKDKPESVCTRQYFHEVASKRIYQGVIYYDDVTKVFYQDNGRYYITQEFRDLLTSKGYTYYGIVNGGYAYMNKDNGISIVVEIKEQSSSNVNDGKPVRALYFMDYNRFNEM